MGRVVEWIHERIPVSTGQLAELTNEPVPNHLKRFAISGARVCAKKKLERHRRWKLRRAAEAAVYRVVAPDDADVSCVQQIFFDRLIRTARCTETAKLIQQ